MSSAQRQASAQAAQDSKADRFPTAESYRGKVVGAEQELLRPDGTKLRIVVAGAGPKTVLLEHGFAMTADAWSTIVPSLVELGLRVIAYDRRGHGASTIGADGLTSANIRADAKAVAEHFDLRDAVLVCHSMGNFFALGLLPDESYSKRFHSAVLVSPVTGHSAKGAPFVRMAAPMVQFGVMQAMARNRANGTKLARMQVGKGASDALVEATRLAMVDIPQRLSPLNHIMIKESVVELLPSISLPLHVLSGTEDATTPGWHAELIAERAPNAKLERVEGFGHMFPWEAPDVVVRAIREAVGE